MSDVNKQLLEAAKLVLQQAENNLAAVNLHILEKLTKAIAAAEQATSSGAGWQDFNDGFKAGAEEMRDGLLQLCKDFSDRQNRPYMGDVLAQVDSLFDLIVLEIPRSLGRKAEQAQAEPVARDVLMALAVEVAQRMVAVSAVASIDDWQKMVGLPAIVDRYAAQPPAVPDEVAKDAARYRWLRSIDSRANENVLVKIATKARNGWSFTTSTCEDLDVAIDKEISALDSQHALIAAAQKGTK